MEETLGQGTENNSSTGSNLGLESHGEKMLRQSEVNDIVGRAKQEAASKAVENYRRSQLESAQHQQRDTHASSESISEERYRKLAAEEAQRLRDEWMSEAQSKSEAESAQRIVKNFHDKIASGKEKYEDFDKVTSGIELHRFPNTVHMLAEFVDNSGDVLYELGKNRSKMAQIELTAREYPQEALYDLKRLAESIKSNEVAGTRKTTNAPLSQQRPSNVGTDSGGTLSMRDLKAKYRM